MMEKFFKSYLYISSYIVCIFPIITLIFCVLYTKIPYLTGILTELSKSLNDYPLSDLEFINNCPEEKYASNLYTVPASYEGCSCVNVKKYPYKQANKSLVFRGKCKKNNTLNGCISINYYPPVDLTRWHSKIFCSKKYINLNGYKEFYKTSVGKNEDCKNGYKKCGKLDETGNYLCLPQNESCPINDIIISDEKNDSLVDYEEYKIGNKYLYFTNKSTENPLITKLKTVEGQLCLAKGFYYTDYPQFILDEYFDLYGCRYKIDGNIYDNSISKLDFMTKNELYNDNNISMYSRYNNSCEYPYYSLNAEIFLYPKRYIGFNKKCLKEKKMDIDNKRFKKEYINAINSNLLKNRRMHNILTWISIAAIDFYFMTCFFINIDEENTLINFYVWCIITLPFYLAMIIVSFIGLVSMGKIKSYPLCNDNLTNSKIDLFNQKSSKIFANTLILFILINGQLLLTIILFFLKRRKILRSEKNITNESQSQTLSSSNYLSSVNTMNTMSQEIPLVIARSNDTD